MHCSCFAGRNERVCHVAAYRTLSRIEPKLDQQIQVIEEILLFHYFAVRHTCYCRALYQYLLICGRYTKKVSCMNSFKCPVFGKLVALAKYVHNAKFNIGEASEIVRIISPCTIDSHHI